MDNVYLVLGDIEVINVIRNVVFHSQGNNFIDMDTANTNAVSL